MVKESHKIDGLVQDCGYLQCVSNGDTAVLHKAIEIILQIVVIKQYLQTKKLKISVYR